MDLAFEYVEKHSLETEADYPYHGTDGKCEEQTTKGIFTITGYKDVAPNNPKQLMAALAQQPVSVAIEADTSVF